MTVADTSRAPIEVIEKRRRGPANPREGRWPPGGPLAHGGVQRPKAAETDQRPASRSEKACRRPVVAAFMKWLLLGTFGFFGLHALLWLPRGFAERRRNRATHHTPVRHDAGDER